MANDWNFPCFHAPEQHGLRGCNIVTCACQAKRRRDYDHSIHSNPDAAAWAKFFCETWKETHPLEPYQPPPDEEWMTGWFANAMMAMHDHLLANKFKEAIREALNRVADDALGHVHEIEGAKLRNEAMLGDYEADVATTEWLRGKSDGARMVIEMLRAEVKKLTTTTGENMAKPPKTRYEWDLLKRCPATTLKHLALANWNGKLFLFPAEWYDRIPDGYVVKTISGSEEVFKKGKTDNTRGGYLAYGVEAVE